MYHKVLVPLDEPLEAEEAFALIQGELAPDAEIILLQVIPFPKTDTVVGHAILGSPQVEYDRYKAMAYLQAIVRRQESNSGRWRPAVVVSDSVADGIIDFAEQEKIDLIAMSTRDRRLITRHAKTNIAKEVEQRATTEVRVLRAQEPTNTRTLEQIDIFSDLFPHQVEQVVSLGQRVQISVGETLGKGGEQAENLFVIIEGAVDLYAHSEIGEISVRIAGPGETFPLAALLGSGTLITSGVALTDLELLTIPRAPLLDLCSTDTRIGMGIYSAIGRLFAQRYSVTLSQLAISGEKELRDTEA